MKSWDEEQPQVVTFLSGPAKSSGSLCDFQKGDSNPTNGLNRDSCP